MSERSPSPARRRTRGGRTVLPILACVALLGAGCRATSTRDTSDAPTTVPRNHERDAGPARTGGVLTIGLSAETDSFNPYSGQWSVPSFEVANAILEPLAAVDELGIAHPYLAESITPNGDYTQWTITARPGVMFHDGERFDADALKKNLDTARTSGLSSQAYATETSVQKVSDLAVVVSFSAPWATFPATLAMQSGYMAAPAMLDDPAGANANPIGTGPFEFESRQRDSYLKTKRNPNYWRSDANGTRLPYLDAIDFQVVPDSSARASSMSAGNIDALDVETPDSLRAQMDAANESRVQLLTNDGAETDEDVLALNTSKPPFDDILARRALAAAVDQDRLSATAYRNTFPAAWGMFEPGSPYYVSKADVGYPGPNPDQAKALLQQYEQAHGSPLSFTMLLPTDPQYLAIGQTFQAAMAEYGIKVDIQAIEQTQLIRSVVVAGDYQSAGFLLRSSPTPDQAYIFLATKANPNGLSLNFTRYDDPALTTAMNDFRAAADPEARVAAIKRVQQELASGLPMIFLVHARAGFAYQNNVHGLQATTYPDTAKAAVAPYPHTPFFTYAWKETSS